MKQGTIRKRKTNKTKKTIMRKTNKTMMRKTMMRKTTMTRLRKTKMKMAVTMLMIATFVFNLSFRVSCCPILYYKKKTTRVIKKNTPRKNTFFFNISNYCFFLLQFIYRCFVSDRRVKKKTKQSDEQSGRNKAFSIVHVASCAAVSDCYVAERR